MIDIKTLIRSYLYYNMINMLTDKVREKKIHVLVKPFTHKILLHIYADHPEQKSMDDLIMYLIKVENEKNG